ncbi:MAG: leucine-rich repeat protein [Clostridia bacterium]|nr:leucine-rich repeat protein [Clostridia bacterium]
MKKGLKKLLTALCVCACALGFAACEKGAKHKHDYVTVPTAPTCTEQGFTKYLCTCGKIRNKDYVEPLGHSFTSFVSNNDGTKTAKCDRSGCNATKTVTNTGEEVHRHDYTAVITLPTCTEQGFITYTCDCGDRYTDGYEEPTGHSFTDYVSDNNAKCEKDGTETATCDHSDCGETDTRTKANSAKGHSFTNYVSDNNATYEKDGTKTAECDRAGCKKTKTVVDAGSMLVENGFWFKTLMVNGANVYGKVSNQTETFSFIGEIGTKGKTKYTVSWDISGDEKIESKTIALSIGDNKVYVIETVDGEPINVYTVVIRRRPMYEVVFDVDGGETVESQTVEEDSCASEPQTARTGYTFAGWDYDFSEPITENTTVTASWTTNKDTAYRVEYYFETLDYGYTHEESTYESGETDTIAFAEIKEFEHFTYNEADSTASGNIAPDGTLVLQLFYTRNVYTVTWVNYDGSLLETEEVLYGEEPYYYAFLDPRREKEGSAYEYNFIGWSPEVSVAEGDIVYTAQYEQMESAYYDVKYNANGGMNEPYSQTKCKGESLTLPTEKPTREGYVFVGWNNLHEETVYQAGDKFTSDFHVTFFAMWEKMCETCEGDGWYTYKEYCCDCSGEGGWEKCSSCRSTLGFMQSITGVGINYWTCRSCGNIGTRTWVNCSQCSGGYNTRYRDCTVCDSGYIKGDAPVAEEIGARSVVLTKLESYEYSLDGVHWQESNVFENLQYSTQYTFYQRVAKTKTTPFGTTSSGLTVTTAEATEFYVTYVLNGGENDRENPYMYLTTGGNIALNAPTREYCEFVGWSYKGSIVTEINASWAEDIELTAVWEPILFSIVYELDGGIAANPTEYHIESEFTLSEPSKEGYTFLGWTGSNGDTPEWSVTVSLGTVGELNYTAHWCINQYTISFVLNNGESRDSITQDYGSELFIQDPVLEGKTFVGWFDSTLTSEYKLVTMPGESLTLYAKWRANEYAVTYDANGGVASKESDTAVYGEEFILASAERVGYSFEGWYVGAVKITDGVWSYANEEGLVTLTAKWTARTDVVYVVNHYFENVEDENYTLVYTENLEGEADSYVTPDVKQSTGFTSPEATEIKIEADGSTLLEYYYTRNVYSITFVANGGASIAKMSLKYQAPLDLPNGERGEYTFGGWFTDSGLATKFTETSMPARSRTLYAWWSEEDKPTDFDYSGNYSVTIKGFHGGSTMWIPEYIGGVPVTTIASKAFYWYDGVNVFEDDNIPCLMKAIIGDRVTSIGASAFSGCRYLTSVTIGKGVKTIEKGAFSNCSALSEVNYNAAECADFSDETYSPFGGGDRNGVKLIIGASVKKIPAYMCYYLNVNNIIFEEGSTCKSIGNYAFYDCAISSIDIPESITSIGSGAFKYCLFTSVTVPDSVTSLGYEVFGGCSRLTSMTLPFLAGSNAGAANLFGHMFGSESYTGGTATTQTYFYFEELIDRYIPSNDEYTFYIPSELKSITVTRGNIFSSFYNCSGLSEITLLNGVKSIGAGSFYGCSGLKSLIIPDGVKNIGDSAFYNCNNLESIVLPESVTTIGFSAFYNCNNLESILLPESLYELKEYTFYGCSSLTSIVIPENIYSIEECVFYGCSKLKSATFKNIGNYWNLFYPESEGGGFYDSVTNELLDTSAAANYLRRGFRMVRW